MYEKDVKFTPDHAPRTSSSGATPTRPAPATRDDTATQRTDPKFVRESNTMRKMHTWQIVALAVAALLVAALVLFYI